MFFFFPFLFLFLLSVSCLITSPFLSLGDASSTSISISFQSDSSAVFWVWYGTSKIDLNLLAMAKGQPKTYNYVSPYENYTSLWISHVLLEGLEASTTYYYVIGNKMNVSVMRSFTMPAAVGTGAIRIGLVGDLGTTHNSSDTISGLSNDKLDVVLFVGDLAYADAGQPNPNENGYPCTQQIWDNFGLMFEPLSSKVPVMILPGNHDIESTDGMPDYLSFTSRFSTPYLSSGSPSPLFYSFEVGLAHIIMLNSYSDYDRDSAQYEFVVNDLEKISRTKTPWLIVCFHAPWYNSNAFHQNEIQETGMKKVFEKIFIKASVDVIFSGHVHAYERSANVAKSVVTPGAPVYINIGDGGNREGPASSWLEPQPEWSAFRQTNFGYGRLTITDANNAEWDWLINGNGTNPSDTLTFVRNTNKLGVQALLRELI